MRILKGRRNYYFTNPVLSTGLVHRPLLYGTKLHHFLMVAWRFCHIQISIERSHIEPEAKPPESIAEHIRFVRLTRNLYHKDVAHIIGVSTTRIEN